MVKELVAVNSRSPFEQAFLKLIREYPASWTEGFDSLTSSEQDAITRLIEIRWAECRTDVKVIGITSGSLHHFMYQVSGYRWCENVSVTAQRDAGKEFNGKRTEDTKVIFGNECFATRLTGEGEAQRRNLKEGLLSENMILAFAKCLETEFHCDRISMRNAANSIGGNQAIAAARADASASVGDIHIHNHIHAQQFANPTPNGPAGADSEWTGWIQKKALKQHFNNHGKEYSTSGWTNFLKTLVEDMDAEDDEPGKGRKTIRIRLSIFKKIGIPSP